MMKMQKSEFMQQSLKIAALLVKFGFII